MDDPTTEPPASRPGAPRGRAPLRNRSAGPPGGAPARVYLSPHLDDAVLSCGGAITAATRQGEEVLILTACAGAPPPDASLTPFARSVLARWGLPDPAAAMQARRVEDEAAACCLGADSFWLDHLDAIYRGDAYTGEVALFGDLAQDDHLSAQIREDLEALLARWPGAVLYAPLGVGQHVDHQAAHAAAAALSEAGHTVMFYEEFPYVARDAGALDRRLALLGGPEAFSSEVVPLDEAALERKIAGIACHGSQIGMLFSDAAAMADAVRAHAASLRSPSAPYGERLWTRRPARP